MAQHLNNIRKKAKLMTFVYRGSIRILIVAGTRDRGRYICCECILGTYSLTWVAFFDYMYK